MGTNSYLLPSDAKPVRFIQFKYGINHETDYRVGDKIIWRDGERPSHADDLVSVSGLHFELGDGEVSRERYFEITVDADIIVSFQEISSKRYQDLGDEPLFHGRIS